MSYKAYIFDIGGVLLDYDLYELAMRVTGGKEDQMDRLLALRNHHSLREVESGRMPPVVYFEEYIKPVAPSCTYRDLVKTWKDIFAVNEDGVRLFRDLKRSGNRVFLLSNLAKFNLEAIEEKFPWLLREANGNFFSFELGCVKPDREIFMTVCARIKVLPSDCFFIDDTAECVASAVKAGMKAVRFSREKIAKIRAECGLPGSGARVHSKAISAKTSAVKSKSASKSRPRRKSRA